MASAEKIPTLIKWTGSKRKQAPFITSLLPSYDRYIEPFLGGGSMLYLNSRKEAVASDAYSPLIELWKLIQEQPNLVISDYERKWKELDIEYADLQEKRVKNAKGLPKVFYTCRDNFNKTHDPLDLNFIMRTCVNGIVRFNDKGEFNNSFHLSRQGMKPDLFASIVNSWYERIEKVNFRCCDYTETFEMAKKGDVVYLDPPYADSHNRYFKDLDVEFFFKELEKLSRKGVSWVLSFDGSRASREYYDGVPKDLYKRKFAVSNGNSAVSGVLNKKTELVTESLYLNY